MGRGLNFIGHYVNQLPSFMGRFKHFLHPHEGFVLVDGIIVGCPSLLCMCMRGDGGNVNISVREPQSVTLGYY